MQFHNLVLTDDACLLYGLSSEVKLREVGLDSLPPVDTTQPSLERAVCPDPARHSIYMDHLLVSCVRSGAMLRAFVF